MCVCVCVLYRRVRIKLALLRFLYLRQTRSAGVGRHRLLNTLFPSFVSLPWSSRSYALTKLLLSPPLSLSLWEIYTWTREYTYACREPLACVPSRAFGSIRPAKIARSLRPPVYVDDDDDDDDDGDVTITATTIQVLLEKIHGKILLNLLFWDMPRYDLAEATIRSCAASFFLFLRFFFVLVCKVVERRRRALTARYGLVTTSTGRSSILSIYLPIYYGYYNERGVFVRVVVPKQPFRGHSSV